MLPKLNAMRNMRILIIEDNPGAANLLCRYLRPLVCQEPIIAKTMAEAIKAIGSNDYFDLITVDINLPDSLGKQTLNKVKDFKDRHPNALLIVVTGVITNEDHVLSYGADGFMTKMDCLASQDSFLTKLSDVARAILRTPEQYRKSVDVLERMVQRIAEQKKLD